MNMSSGSLALVAAAAVGMTGIDPAAPVEGPDMLQIQSETVRYDAMDINNRKSARQLFFRIRQAAEEVCRTSSFPRGYEIWSEHDCATAAVEQAVGDAGMPALTEYYDDMLARPLRWRR